MSEYVIEHLTSHIAALRHDEARYERYIRESHEQIGRCEELRAKTAAAIASTENLLTKLGAPTDG